MPECVLAHIETESTQKLCQGREGGTQTWLASCMFAGKISLSRVVRCFSRTKHNGTNLKNAQFSWADQYHRHHFVDLKEGQNYTKGNDQAIWNTKSVCLLKKKFSTSSSDNSLPTFSPFLCNFSEIRCIKISF